MSVGPLTFPFLFLVFGEVLRGFFAIGVLLALRLLKGASKE